MEEAMEKSNQVLKVEIVFLRVWVCVCVCVCVNLKPLTIFAKSSIFNVWLGSDCASYNWYGDQFLGASKGSINLRKDFANHHQNIWNLFLGQYLFTIFFWTSLDECLWGRNIILWEVCYFRNSSNIQIAAWNYKTSLQKNLIEIHEKSESQALFK